VADHVKATQVSQAVKISRSIRTDLKSVGRVEDGEGLGTGLLVDASDTEKIAGRKMIKLVVIVKLDSIMIRVVAQMWFDGATRMKREGVDGSTYK
jgi:hypothetical protein